MTDPSKLHEHSCANTMSPDLRAFVDRVVVPALLERFLREQAASAEPSKAHRQGP